MSGEELLKRHTEMADVKKKGRKRPTAGTRYPEHWQAWIANEVMKGMSLEVHASMHRRRARLKMPEQLPILAGQGRPR